MSKQQKTYTREFKLEAVQVWAMPPPISPQPRTPALLIAIDYTSFTNSSITRLTPGSMPKTMV
jgi:hypothetical protein